MMSPIIDTHVHVWDFEQAEYAWLKNNTTLLNRTYSIGEIEAERLELNITGGILVQAANTFEETDWMLKVADHTDWITGVVGWVPLTDPAAAHKAIIEKYGKNPCFKGVRHLMHDEPATDWLLQPAIIESLRMLAANKYPYEVVCISSEHIQTVLKVAEQVPSLTMVFDHLSQPPIKTKERFGKWGELMKEAAQHPNLYAKISGLGTTAHNGMDWSAEDLQPYIEFALEHFGEDRCFCGGDWPVSLLAGSYTRTWTTYQQIVSSLLTEAQQQKVFHTNAINFYDY